MVLRGPDGLVDPATIEGMPELLRKANQLTEMLILAGPSDAEVGHLRQHGRMRAFDHKHEAEALETITAELAPTLIKLTHPGSGKNLRAVVLRSARLGHELRWRAAGRGRRLDLSIGPLLASPAL